MTNVKSVDGCLARTVVSTCKLSVKKNQLENVQHSTGSEKSKASMQWYTNTFMHEYIICTCRHVHIHVLTYLYNIYIYMHIFYRYIHIGWRFVERFLGRCNLLFSIDHPKQLHYLILGRAV